MSVQSRFPLILTRRITQIKYLTYLSGDLDLNFDSHFSHTLQRGVSHQLILSYPALRHVVLDHLLQIQRFLDQRSQVAWGQLCGTDISHFFCLTASLNIHFNVFISVSRFIFMSVS